MIEPVSESYEGKCSLRVFESFSLFQARELQRQLDVLQGGQNRHKVEALKDETDMDVAPYRQAIGAERGQILSQQANLSASRPIEAGQNVQ